jgi:hypothetical protein
MVTRTLPEKKKRLKNGTQPEHKDPFKTKKPNTREFWPDDIEDAYRRASGPYTIANAITLIEEEPLELFNGWLVWQEMTNAEERRIAAKVADFFSKNLSAEQIVGEAAQQWRAESEEKGRDVGREEGELEALRKVLLRQASRRYGVANLPADLETKLREYNTDQLIELADGIAVGLNLKDWLASFPE